MARVGRIIGLIATPGSGLYELEIEHTVEDGYVPIESGYGMRTLAAAFGATEGAGDLLEKIIGREIEYEVDSMGIMLRFAPTEFADFEEGV